ncbi:MAG: N-acetylmuramoyl-L-alanine amidase [Paraclostridium sp.]
MLVCVVAGHTLTPNKGCGAVGYINESNENRILSNKIVEYLKKAKVEVDYFEVSEANDYLQKQASFANKKNYDLVVQVHFNANKNTLSAMGTETLYSSNRGKPFADKVNNNLAKMYKNRGIKLRNDLYWLNNTKAPAILIETCFVDSKADTDIYIINKDITAKLIAEAIAGKSIEDSKPIVDNNTFYRVVAGSYSDRANALKQIELLESKGIKNAFIDIYKK